MKNSGIIILVLSIISQLHVCTVGSLASSTEEELEVILQFFEFELEDICIARSEALWGFLTGNKTNLKQLLEQELKEAELYKNETTTFYDISHKPFKSRRLQRLFDIFSNPGAPRLEATELKEYKEYSVKLQEIVSKMELGCRMKGESDGTKTVDESCVPKSYRTVNKILSKEKDEKLLKNLWSQWFEEFESENRRTKLDFMHQLSILDMEAEQNEEDELTNYWLKQTDIQNLDYHAVSLIWKEIIPLYQKLRKFMADIMEQKYGGNIIIDNKLFPIYLFGSLKPRNWNVAAEKLGAFNHAKPYRFFKSKLNGKNFEDLYKMADNFTSEMKMGDLPHEFYNNSLFNVTSPFCEGKIFDYCTRKTAFRAISCSDEEATISQFIKIHEDVAKLKHLIVAGKETQEDENGYLFREGPRDSVIYEAVAGLSSLIALSPKNLRKQHLLPGSTLPEEEIVSLMISALDIIPSLPYYLAADLWRINALKEMDATAGESNYESSTVVVYSSTPNVYSEEEDSPSNMRKRDILEADSDAEDENNDTEKSEEANSYSETTPTSKDSSYVTQSMSSSQKIYDFHNLTVDWWKYREQLQGIGNSDGQLYADFLLDEKIIWNKPYLSKFLGSILQFQLLECLQGNSSIGENNIHALLRKGKSQPAEEILAEMFSITEISAKPLLRYFKPLEDFLDSGRKFQSDPSESDDIALFSDSYSMNSSPGEDGAETQKGSNTIVFSLLILTVLGIVSVAIFMTLKRYRAKQRTKERRKKMNTNIE
ncbi:UNVERIFIED_CONTAM: hypothetical protein PYX00_008780 [Menopon gallinae]|uniref:Angiotensin-converting enzyme n=1 Tax=Menopon gallinae TaxID=328185 RepID=A0AAW2HPC9_9NEOP